ncbi:helix-turn-helix transcriptional regulator [Bordetella sp. BOR01]|uniref:ArsR/SmtB family transcription factor n=1 Tax=Bordetella sp. BOR01 TaxID=2854779 RepID=UPI001C437D37|nr:helix-turn-helix domain-containing protein [Bordetella sp. BOR01]MBV7482067.1 helix-turn-helix domain-containing protein [Bordetella sp. BOR01]
MTYQPGFAATAFLLADHARAAMLAALLDGRALPAGELARTAGVTAQTASAHLAKMLAGGLLQVETEGRHRYYRLAGAHVASMLEGLSVIQPETQASRRPALSPQAREFRFCRRCYDHLAGQLGVAVTQALQDRDYLLAAPDKQFDVTPGGAAWFSGIGVDVDGLAPTRRGLARQCLDCTERRHHLAGPLGVALLAAMCEQQWLRRDARSRAIKVTPRGWTWLDEQLGIQAPALPLAA